MDKVAQSCSTFVTPWTVAHQAPPPMGFPRKEYWSGLPFPSPGDLPDSGIEPRSPTLQAVSLPSELPRKPQVGKVVWYSHLLKNIPQFVAIYTVKSFGIVNKADVFLELSCFYDDPTDVDNVISGSYAFSNPA